MGYTKTQDELNQYYGIKERKFVGAEMMGAMFLTKPEIVERLLPPPLEAADGPMGMMFIAKYPDTNLGPGYNEAALYLNCKYEGEPGTYCLSMPIDSEPLRMHNGRDIFGFPKKMAEIHMERKGNTAHGWVKRAGVTFVELKVDLTGSLPELPPTGPTYLFKASPRIDLTPGFDGPVLLCSQKTDVEMKSFEIGTPQLTLRESNVDPWAEVEIEQVMIAFYMISDNTMNPGRVIGEVDGDAYLPYYFKMADFPVGK